jgi:hypothetical protein
MNGLLFSKELQKYPRQLEQNGLYLAQAKNCHAALIHTENFGQ